MHEEIEAHSGGGGSLLLTTKGRKKRGNLREKKDERVHCHLGPWNAPKSGKKGNSCERKGHARENQPVGGSQSLSHLSGTMVNTLGGGGVASKSARVTPTHLTSF